MKHRSPLVTLVGLVVAFGVMLGVNFASASPPGSYNAGAASGSPSAPPPTNAAPTPSTQPPSAAPSETAPTAAPRQSPATEAPSEFADKVVYAGRTKDGSAAIAVAVRGDKAAAYLCDGRSIEAWLSGAVDGNQIDVKGKGKARLTATLVGSTLEGSITIGSNDYDFAINKAKKPAGLYRAKGDKSTVGWIVLPGGSQVGLQTSAEGSTPAPQLYPDALEVAVDGESLQAEPVSGDENL